MATTPDRRTANRDLRASPYSRPRPPQPPFPSFSLSSTPEASPDLPGRILIPGESLTAEGAHRGVGPVRMARSGDSSPCSTSSATGTPTGPPRAIPGLGNQLSLALNRSISEDVGGNLLDLTLASPTHCFSGGPTDRRPPFLGVPLLPATSTKAGGAFAATAATAASFAASFADVEHLSAPSTSQMPAAAPSAPWAAKSAAGASSDESGLGYQEDESLIGACQTLHALHVT